MTRVKSRKWLVSLSILLVAVQISAVSRACPTNLLSGPGRLHSAASPPIIILPTTGVTYSIVYDDNSCPSLSIRLISGFFPIPEPEFGEPLRLSLSLSGSQSFAGLDTNIDLDLNGEFRRSEVSISIGDESSDVSVGLLDQKGLFWIAEFSLSSTQTETLSSSITFRLTDLANKFEFDILDYLPLIIAASKRNTKTNTARKP